MVNLLRRLGRRGFHAADIAKIITATYGVHVDEASVRAKAQKELIVLRSPPNMTTLAIGVDRDTLAALRRAARARGGLSVEQLVRTLIDAALETAPAATRRRQNGAALISAEQ